MCQMCALRKNLSGKNHRDARQKWNGENDGSRKMFALFLLPRNLSRRRDFFAEVHLVK